MSRYTRQLKQTGSITRVPPASSDPTAREDVVSSLKCSYPYPASKDAAERAGLATVAQLLEAFTAVPTEAVNTRHMFNVGGEEFRIRAINEWPYANPEYLHLLLEVETG